jgi:carbonic anhydrase
MSMKANVFITFYGEIVYQARLRLAKQGKCSGIELSLDTLQLDHLINQLQRVKKRRDDAIQQQKAMCVEKQAKQLINDLTGLSVMQQVASIVQHVVKPAVKKWVQDHKD